MWIDWGNYLITNSNCSAQVERGGGFYSKGDKEPFFLLWLGKVLRKMEKDDKKLNPLRIFKSYRIGFLIGYQTVQKGGGIKPLGNITILQKAAPITSHLLLRCQVVLIIRLFCAKYFFSGLFFSFFSEFAFQFEENLSFF